MRSLTLKLTLAFLVVSLAGTALVAVLVWQTTSAAFDRYVLDQMRDDFVTQASAYYEARGTWSGVTEYFHRAQPPVLQPPPSQPAPQPPASQLADPFVLAAADGRVVVPARPYRVGDLAPADELARGEPIQVDGQTVGTVLTVVLPPQRSSRDKAYLAYTNQALLAAALVATAVALVLGILLARTLTRPVRELTAATRSLSRGNLAQQVPVRSRDELGELTASFNQMSADLARANDLRRQMTADIAHDLRTPLSVITGYTEALRDGVLLPTPQILQTMHQEAVHLRRLVEDLRTLSLADAGELTLTRCPVSPRELLDRAALAFGPRAQELGIDWRVTVDGDVPPVHVDPERLAQVLGNLVSNALRHTPSGGHITLAAGVQGDGVWLTVQDTGVGIAPENLPCVFDRFYRSDEARQVHEGESGLGLAIAKAIVELHGGAIAVESTLGVGTRFTIT
ncbi:MAG: HAMP domain-containing protein, partial [Anaerolineae bacterium]|nr:HAMP domain-containing protein [Anaerolineae bacterium]